MAATTGRASDGRLTSSATGSHAFLVTPIGAWLLGRRLLPICKFPNSTGSARSNSCPSKTLLPVVRMTAQGGVGRAGGSGPGWRSVVPDERFISLKSGGQFGPAGRPRRRGVPPAGLGPAGPTAGPGPTDSRPDRVVPGGRVGYYRCRGAGVNPAGLPVPTDSEKMGRAWGPSITPDPDVRGRGVVQPDRKRDHVAARARTRDFPTLTDEGKRYDGPRIHLTARPTGVSS